MFPVSVLNHFHQHDTRLRRNLAIVWLLLCAAGLFALGLHLIRAGRNWPLGDWLINYEGGFVRRGLLGQVLLITGHLFHADPIVLAVAICLGSYSLVFTVIWMLLGQDDVAWWQVVALLSPATLTFPLLSTRAGFHKEVLLYACLCGLLWAFRLAGSAPSSLVVSVALCVICVVLLLSHEPLVFYLPYLFAVPAMASGSARTILRVAALPLLCSVVCFTFVLHHIGTPAAVAAICQSVQHESERCADPIVFLTMTRAGQLAMVQQNIAEFHYARMFPVLVLLTVLPFLLGARALWHRPAARPHLRVVLIAFAVAAPASIALFRFGPDWGRWVAMHAMCLLLLLFWIAQRTTPIRTTNVDLPRARSTTLLWLCGVAVYASCWSMPGFGDTPVHGLVGLLFHHP